ncbi:MAG: DNA repair protein RadC [Anaerolineae bacterium]|nr:DNA repair protein RadC [Anaerolineae bacterium]
MTRTPADRASLSLHDLPASERPRERLLRLGAEALTNAELLALILRTGSQQDSVVHLAERVLARIGGLHGLLGVRQADLMDLHGLGETKRTQLLATAELARRLSTITPHDQPVVRKAEDAVGLVQDMAYLVQEHVRVLLLDSGGRVVAISTIYIGTLNASVVRVAEVYREAIARNCPALILAHNHPSGDSAPSPEDVELTRALAAAGDLLDIKFVDHLIVARGGWTSLRESNLGF